MTQEEIENAGRIEREKIINELQDGYNNHHHDINLYTVASATIGQYALPLFIAGAKWRINSAWHSTSEEPEVDRHCIIEVEAYEDDGTKYTDYVSSVWSTYGWTEDYLELIERRSEGQYKITKWAYVEDILPNKEE